MKILFVTLILFVAFVCNERSVSSSPVKTFQLLNGIKLEQNSVKPLKTYGTYCFYVQLHLSPLNISHTLWITDDLKKQHWDKVQLTGGESNPLLFFSPYIPRPTVTVKYQHSNGEFEYVSLKNYAGRNCRTALLTDSGSEFSKAELLDILSSTPDPPQNSDLVLNNTMRRKLAAGITLMKDGNNNAFEQMLTYNWNNELVHMVLINFIFPEYLHFDKSAAPIYKWVLSLMEKNPSYYSNLLLHKFFLTKVANYQPYFYDVRDSGYTTHAFRYARLRQKLEQLQDSPKAVLSMPFNNYMFKKLSGISDPVAFVSTKKEVDEITVRVGSNRTGYNYESIACKYIDANFDIHDAPWCQVVDTICECKISGSDNPNTPIRFDLSNENDHLIYITQQVFYNSNWSNISWLTVTVYGLPVLTIIICFAGCIFFGLALFCLFKGRSYRSLSKKNNHRNYQNV